MPLRAIIGDLPVWRTQLDLLVDTRHFLDRPGQMSLLPPLPDAVDGYLITSQVDQEPSFTMRQTAEFVEYVPRRYLRYWVNLALGHDRYLQNFSSKTRSTLRRKTSRFAAADGGTLDFRVYRTSEGMADFHRLARPVSQATYQECFLGVGLPSTDSFIEAMRKRADAGAVRGYLLCLSGRPVAFTYCPIDDGVVIYGFTGFDPEFGRLSPGTVLLWKMLEDLYRDSEGLRLFDFTEGEGEHKALFATDSMRCRDLYRLRRRLRPVRCALMHWTLEGGGTAAARLLERLGCKAQLRRLLRGHS